MGYKNLLYNYDKKKVFAIFAVLFIFSFVIFSSFYNHNRTKAERNYWYMAEETNKAAIWSRTYIPENTHVYTMVGDWWRGQAISDGHIQFPSISALALTYGFVNESEALDSTINNSYTSLDFYFDAPYVQKGGTSKLGEYKWLESFDVKNDRVTHFMKKYDIKYIVYDRYSGKSTLINSVKEHNTKIYDDGRIKFWLP